jgi:SAM-dependent methyltransferase
MDLWGRIYLDHWRGDCHPHEFIRDDGKTQRIPSAAAYFEAPRNGVQRHALETLTGRILDLGCGAGSYTRFLEERGLAVTAIDVSPGAITVCRERGCRDARVADIDALPLDLQPFDAIICMGNTLGVDARPDTLPRRLSALLAICRPAARLVAMIRDPLSTTDPEHIAYHNRNRAMGRPPGLVRSRISYRGELGEWWELWMPTQSELELAAQQSGWTVQCQSAEAALRLYDLSSS